MALFGWNWGFGTWSSIWAGFFVIVLIVPWFFFLLNLRGLLEQVSPTNRAMQPDHVWLNFIPVFNLGWYFHTIARVRDSVRAEYVNRGWPVEGDLGYNIGLAAGIVGICSLALGWAPFLDGVLGLAALVCWILYWLKMSEFRQSLPPRAWDGQYAPPVYPGHQMPPDRPQETPSGQRSAQAPSQPPERPTATPASASTQQPPVIRPRSEPVPVDEAPPLGGQPPVDSVTSPGEPALHGESTTQSRPASTRQCAVCATMVAPDDRFCRGCGLPLSR